jgi:hypothetical protein
MDKDTGLSEEGYAEANPELVEILESLIVD